MYSSSVNPDNYWVLVGTESKIMIRITQPISIETSPVKQYLQPILFVPRSRKKLLFLCFFMQPITAIQVNAMCDCPTSLKAWLHYTPEASDKNKNKCLSCGKSI